MSLPIRFVELPPHAQAGPIYVSRYEHASPHPEHTAATFFNHDHTVLILHQGAPAVIEQAVLGEHGPTSWTLSRGDVLVIPAGAPHRRQDPGGPFVAAAFCAACLELDDVVTAPLHRVRAGASPVVRIPPERQDHVAHLFDELQAASTNPAVPAIVTKSLLVVLLHELARTQLIPHSGDTLLADTLRFIERRCLGPLTLADVARHVRRTPSHLATLVKKATGQTILGWITSHRMAEARRRLRHSDEQIDIIAERVGYADPTHFIRVFRRHHGQTPAAWRRGRS